MEQTLRNEITDDKYKVAEARDNNFKAEMHWHPELKQIAIIGIGYFSDNDGDVSQEIISFDEVSTVGTLYEMISKFGFNEASFAL